MAGVRSVAILDEIQARRLKHSTRVRPTFKKLMCFKVEILSSILFELDAAAQLFTLPFVVLKIWSIPFVADSCGRCNV